MRLLVLGVQDTSSRLQFAFPGLSEFGVQYVLMVDDLTWLSMFISSFIVSTFT